MKIQREENENKGRFFIEEMDKNIALMTYKKSGAGKITIDHTEVDPNFRGEGLGKDLIAEAVDFARTNNLKIAATCPYAEKIFEETSAFDDVFEK